MSDSTTTIEKLKAERRELKIEIRRLNRELLKYRVEEKSKEPKGFFDKMIICSGEIE